MYICDFSRSDGAGSATTRNTRGLTRSVMALMVPPLPAASRPSKTMITRRPLCLTHSCSLHSSPCSLRSSFSYFLALHLLRRRRLCILAHNDFCQVRVCVGWLRAFAGLPAARRGSVGVPRASATAVRFGDHSAGPRSVGWLGRTWLISGATGLRSRRCRGLGCRLRCATAADLRLAAWASFCRPASASDLLRPRHRVLGAAWLASWRGGRLPSPLCRRRLASRACSLARLPLAFGLLPGEARDLDLADELREPACLLSVLSLLIVRVAWRG